MVTSTVCEAEAQHAQNDDHRNEHRQQQEGMNDQDAQILDESEWYRRLPQQISHLRRTYDQEGNYGGNRGIRGIRGNKELHIAPMLDVTNREFRQFMRILSKRCVLWTEMVVDETIQYTKQPLDAYLAYDSDNNTGNDAATSTADITQHPIICQIGSNTPEYAANIASILEHDYRYDEINLNIDCPSNRVSGKREFGAVLMKKMDVTLGVIRSLAKASNNIPISIKCRVGIDDRDTLEYVATFIRKMLPYCQKFYLHARKCVLGGLLSPAQNRIVPPLNYPRVYMLCTMFPQCEFWINGGIPGLKAAKALCYGTMLAEEVWKNDAGGESDGDDGDNDNIGASQNTAHGHVVPCQLCGANNGSCTVAPPIAPPNLRGCMLGRAARDNPSMFWDVDRYFYGEPTNPCSNRREVLQRYCGYLERMYPRRCCDSDDEITQRIPAPQVVHERPHCDICKPRDAAEDDSAVGTDANGRSMATQPESALNTTTTTSGSNNGKKQKQKNKAKCKITVHVIGRSLQPIMGLFHGVSHSRKFRRVCDEYRNSTSIRNCGPAYIIRQIMEKTPAELLEEPFVPTENLADIPVHVAPASDCCQQRERALERRRMLKGRKEGQPQVMAKNPECCE